LTFKKIYIDRLEYIQPDSPLLRPCRDKFAQSLVKELVEIFLYYQRDEKYNLNPWKRRFMVIIPLGMEVRSRNVMQPWP